jgi:hypothetical protein
MNENLEERKQQIANYYEEEYREKPRKWWWGKSENKYESTRVIYERNHYPVFYEEEIMIRNNKKGAAFTVAFLFFMGMPIWANSTTWKNEGGQISMVAYGAFLVWSLYNLCDRRPKIILAKDGFQTAKLNTSLCWKDIIAAYIKEDDTGESSSFSLLVHYYDRSIDEFCTTEYLVDSLEAKYETIACMVEYFKRQYGKEDAFLKVHNRYPTLA